MIENGIEYQDGYPVRDVRVTDTVAGGYGGCAWSDRCREYAWERVIRPPTAYTGAVFGYYCDEHWNDGCRGTGPLAR